MHKSIPVTISLILGACLAFLGLNAHAIPIHSFSLSSASGTSSYTYSWSYGDPVNESLTLSGWELDNTWTTANMVFKNGGLGETGLGVTCNTTPPGNSCGQSEIGTTPWQMIDVNISDITGYNSLNIGAASVNTSNTSTGKETAYLYGANCTPGGGCTPTLLDSYTYPGGSYPADTILWNFSLTNLQNLGYTDLWLTPNAWDTTPNNNGNILLWAGPDGNGFNVGVVPEPSELGLFGLGLLMIGLVVGLRRRKSH